jgi:hypothetical protein
MADKRKSDQDEPVPAGNDEQIRGVAEDDDDFEDTDDLVDDDEEEEEERSTF